MQHLLVHSLPLARAAWQQVSFFGEVSAAIDGVPASTATQTVRIIAWNDFISNRLGACSLAERSPSTDI